MKDQLRTLLSRQDGHKVLRTIFHFDRTSVSRGETARRTLKIECMNDFGADRQFRCFREVDDFQKRLNYRPSPFSRCICFVQQLLGLRATRRGNAQEVYTNPIALGYLDADANVFITGHHKCIAHRAIASQFDQISDDQAVHALLFTLGVDETKP